MDFGHSFQRLTPFDSAYRWNRNNRRCEHCHVGEDQVDVDRCPVLVARQAGRTTISEALDHALKEAS